MDAEVTGLKDTPPPYVGSYGAGIPPLVLVILIVLSNPKMSQIEYEND